MHGTSRITNLLPELAYERPRGWSVDSTWDAVSGLFDVGTRRIIVAEHFEFLGEERRTGHPTAILRHEIGHALDHAWARLSHGALFTDCYVRGLERATMSSQFGSLEYFIQPDADSPWAGREETFAELAGIVLGGGGAPDLQERMVECFTEAFAFVRDRIRRVDPP